MHLLRHESLSVGQAPCPASNAGANANANLPKRSCDTRLNNIDSIFAGVDGGELNNQLKLINKQ